MFNISKFEDKKRAEIELELANINYEIKKLDLEIAEIEKKEANAEYELVDGGLTEEEFEELTNTILDKKPSDEDSWNGEYHLKISYNMETFEIEGMEFLDDL